MRVLALEPVALRKRTDRPPTSGLPHET